MTAFLAGILFGAVLGAFGIHGLTWHREGQKMCAWCHVPMDASGGGFWWFLRQEHLSCQRHREELEARNARPLDP